VAHLCCSFIFLSAPTYKHYFIMFSYVFSSVTACCDAHVQGRSTVHWTSTHPIALCVPTVADAFSSKVSLHKVLFSLEHMVAVSTWVYCNTTSDKKRDHIFEFIICRIVSMRREDVFVDRYLIFSGN
jgi:hypothetical protein